jgi:hypothetical protein
VTDQGDGLMEPELAFAFEVRVDVEDPVRVGAHGEHDVLWYVAITGGSVSGPRLSGEVLAGGGDWYRDRDGTVTLEARYLLRAADGAVIDIVNRGFWRASPEVTARLDAGEQVDERDYYYRTAPVFTTDAPPHRWLTETVLVGLARQEGATICIRFFALA